MASDKRNFTNFGDKEVFPGSINKDKNWYEFPVLYKTASTGKPRQWTMYCRLIKEDSVNQKETQNQNWNLLIENEVDIKDKYLVNGERIPSGIVAEIWSEAGIIGMKISRSAETYVSEPKNLGKKNERNVLQQSLVIMRGKYLKKIDDGSVLKLTKTPETQTTTKKFYPMLAKKYDDFINKIKYPIFIQPKLDGNRCVTYLNKIDNPTYKDVIMYTRSLKEFPYNNANDNIRKAVLEFLINNYDKSKKESIYLDGELYLHNKSLQEINSDVRGQNANTNIQYWIYDMFYPSYKDESFEYRTKLLHTIYNKIVKSPKDKTDDLVKFTKIVKTDLINNKTECDKIYKQYLSDNFEGIMLREPTGEYLKSATKKSEQLRSKTLLKRKEVYDDEFEVVGYKDGKNGKEIGAIIWICESKNKDNDTFSVTPNMPLKDRYEIFKECEKRFDKKYNGRLLTVQYRGLSDKGIPLQVKAVGFRDTE